jgi:hypothetical protein
MCQSNKCIYQDCDLPALNYADGHTLCLLHHPKEGDHYQEISDNFFKFFPEYYANLSTEYTWLDGIVFPGVEYLELNDIKYKKGTVYLVNCHFMGDMYGNVVQIRFLSEFLIITKSTSKAKELHICNSLGSIKMTGCKCKKINFSIGKSEIRAKLKQMMNEAWWEFDKNKFSSFYIFNSEMDGTISISGEITSLI